MPTFEYYCPENSRTVEVLHGMTTELQTWGEVCEKAGVEAGDTPVDTPVEKLMGIGMMAAKPKPRSNGETPPSGGCCGGMCQGH